MIRLIAVALAAIALLAGIPAEAQQGPPPFTDSAVIPQTPAYKRALEIVELINRGDAAESEAYVREHFHEAMLGADSPTAHARFLAEVRRTNGRLAVHSARTYEPARPANSAVVIARGDLIESWRGVIVELEEAEPHRITALRVTPARTPTNLPKADRLTDAQIAERLGEYVDRLASAELFSGTMLLAHDGRVLVTRAAGIANRDFDAPVTLDTKFNLGSMNKMMTAVACAQLVEAGKLSLDDPLSKHLSEDWLPQVDKSKVTLRHLLTHTSGLGSYFTEDWDRTSRALYRSVDDWKPIVRQETLAFEPGTRWAYSNTGMLIAGAIVEKASGMNYYDYVQSHITGPAGMANTGFFETDRVNKNLAVGYEIATDPDGTRYYHNNLYQHVIRGGPAGGGYSTVEDLLKFDRALRGGTLVKGESLEGLWRAYPELHSVDYGLGFEIWQTPAGKVVGHEGGFNGISAALHMYLESGHTVAVLANHTEIAASVAARARELIGQGR